MGYFSPMLGLLFYASTSLFSAVWCSVVILSRFYDGNCYEISFLASVICPLCNVLRCIMWRHVTHIHPHHAGSQAQPWRASWHGRGEGHPPCQRYIYTHIYTDQELRLLTTEATVNIFRASICISVNILRASVCISITTQTFLKYFIIYIFFTWQGS